MSLISNIRNYARDAEDINGSIFSDIDKLEQELEEKNRYIKSLKKELRFENNEITSAGKQNQKLKRRIKKYIKNQKDYLKNNSMSLIEFILFFEDDLLAMIREVEYA